VETVLYSFSGGVNGFWPEAPLIQATDGKLYGTTNSGGTGSTCPGGCGTIFSITTSGSLTPLYNFCTNGIWPSCSDGYNPVAGLFQATNGALYGTTLDPNGYGTVYSLSMGLGPFIQLVPTTGKAGQDITILGTGLNGATSVTFNGKAASFTMNSPTAIRAIVPANATTGLVEVVTPGGTLKSDVRFVVR
jgi:uncharacterized repeat protein (TIGR03803 family)